MSDNDKGEEEKRLLDTSRRPFLKLAGLGAFAGAGFPFASEAASAVADSSSTESGEVVLGQDFEGLPVGAYPNGWEKDGNQNQRVTDKYAASGTKSLNLHGSHGGCWQAVANAPLEFPDKGRLEISFAFRPTTNGSFGCHSYRGEMDARTDVGSWSSGNGTTLLRFEPNGTVSAYGETVGDYSVNSWNRINYLYTRKQTSNGEKVIVEITVDPSGNTAATTTKLERDSTDFENQLKYLTFRSGDFTAQVDDIYVTKSNSRKQPRLSIQNTRLTQEVEKTQLEFLSDISDPELVSSAAGRGPLVAQRETAPLFDITGKNVEYLTEAVPVEVTWTYKGDTITDSFELRKDIVKRIASNTVPSLSAVLAGFRPIIDGETYRTGTILTWHGSTTEGRVTFRRPRDGKEETYYLGNSDDILAVSSSTDDLESLGTGTWELRINDEIEATFTIERGRSPNSSDLLTDESDSYPVRPLDEEISSVTVTVGDDSTTFDTVQSKAVFDSQSVHAMDPLNIGIISVERPQDYGAVEDDKYRAKTAEIIRYLNKYYPTHKVNAYRCDVPYLGGFSYPGSSFTGDLQGAYDDLANELPVKSGEEEKGVLLTSELGSVESALEELVMDSFDVTLAITPERYFNYHDVIPEIGDIKKLLGVEMKYPDSLLDDDSKPGQQPFSSAAIEVSSSVSTAAQEVGHHFTNLPYDSPYSRTDGDKAHISAGVESIVIDYEGDILSMSPAQKSFMSYASRQNWLGPDQFTRQKLIEGELNPRPPESYSHVGDLLIIAATVTEGGSINIHQIRKSSGKITESIDSGSLDIMAVSPSDGIIADQTTATELLGMHGAGGPHSYEDSVLVRSPYPQETYKLRFFEKESETTTEIIPASRSLAGLIDLLPNQAFRKAPHNRRKTLKNKIQAMQKQMEEKSFKGAKKKLQKDIKKMIERWIRDEYNTSINQPSKEELLEEISDTAGRIQKLAERSKNGRA